MNRAVWIGIGVLLGTAVPVLAQTLSPEGDFNFSHVEWHSNCMRPVWDAYAHEANGAEDAQYAFSQYQRCLESHAQNDTRYLTQSVFEQAKRELDEVKRDGTIWGFSF